VADSEKSLKKPEKSKKKSSSKKKRHKIRSIHIQPTDNNGFIATHEHEPDEDDETGQAPPSTIHALGNLDQLHQHLDDTLGGAPGGGQAPPAAQEAPPAAAGGMAGM
jgi:hypothetical protein